MYRVTHKINNEIEIRFSQCHALLAMRYWLCVTGYALRAMRYGLCITQRVMGYVLPPISYKLYITGYTLRVMRYGLCVTPL